MSTHPHFYLLSGRHRRLTDGLGAALSQRGCTLAGRELVDGFARLPFGEQVAAVAADLQALDGPRLARVVAHSFGAYLLLHALALRPPFAGPILLLSPVVGEAADGQGRIFSPPRAGQLQQRLAQGLYPLPVRCNIHVGGQDWQCPVDAVRALGDALGATTTVLPDAGHRLPAPYVGRVLDAWLGISNPPLPKK
ncbi:MAG: alpha/beta fold hydrolase [Comamonadaceae bacterium]|nr:alpha/beta fold hydrolase [Comamonadaceae bacterium]